MSGKYGDEYGQDIIPGEIGSNTITQAADNSGNTVANVGGLTESVFDPTYGGTLSNPNTNTGIANLKQFVTDNKGWLAAAGALGSVYGGGTNADKKTGYQGTIPLLSASRSMITAPPTRAQGYRPGAGGIDYGGDVSYKLAPGQDPWASLSGTSGSSANANLTDTAGITGLPANVANAVANALTGGGTKTTTVTGGTGKDTITGGGGKDTITGGGGNDTIVKNLGSTGYQAAMKAGLTPMQYFNNINQWILDNPRASKDQVAAAMKQFGVSDTDLQTALGQSNFSNATKYGLTHGMGLQEMNMNIANWVAEHPYATNADIQAIQKKYGVSDEDVARGLNALTTSAGKEYAIVHDMGLDQLYKNILDYQAAGHTPAEIAAAMAATGVEQRDINAAARYAADTGYQANAASQAGIQQFLPPTKQNEVQNLTPPPVIPPPVQQPSGLDTKNEIYQYFASPATQAALASGDIRSIADTMDALGYSPAEVAAATGTPLADVQSAYNSVRDNSYMQYAAGGEITMAKGRYLQGETDGMADELPAKIGADEPAALSHGEFVVPADVVSHLGNGNSDAGAKKLYQMMDKIRMARTGNKKQGKRINPDNFMPGGLAYAKGGKVKKFAGETDSLVTGNKAYSSGIQGIESNLSNWAGPYVTNMLGQGQALANMPYQAYMGPLTAGESPLQTGAFKTAAGMTTPTSIGEAATAAGNIGTAAQGLKYTPTTETFGATQAQAYMNPYLQASLNPQLEEARRQSQITQQQNAAKMTQAGAFGGSRQAILDAETQRNLGTNLANITGQGYSTAYDKAMAQFNADQARKAQEAQFGATYGLQGLQTGLQAAQAQGALGTQQSQAGINALNAQLGAGAQQRGIEAEGIAADKAQFEEARANPYKMVQYQQSLLQGLPLAAQSYQGIEPSALLKASQGATTVNALLKNLGLI